MTIGLNQLSHKHLCNIRREWLIRTKKCNPVFIEKGTDVAKEIPDIIGWNRTKSILIECKTSYQDFLVDQKKEHRQGKGMGTIRYYLCEKNVITIKDLPDEWGLLYAIRELNNIRCKQIHAPIERNDNCINLREELGFLRSRLLEVQRFGR